MNEELQGTEITSVYTSFEHVVVVAGDKAYYIQPEELIKVLSEFDFQAETKRTRTWLHVDIENYRVEKYDQPRT
jgi:hypothetical protein